MQSQAYEVVTSGGRIGTSILYRFTALDCTNMTGNGWLFFNSRVVCGETSGSCLNGPDMLLAPAFGYNTHAEKIDGSSIKLLRRMLPAKRSRLPLFDPAHTPMRD